MGIDAVSKPINRTAAKMSFQFSAPALCLPFKIKPLSLELLIKRGPLNLKSLTARADFLNFWRFIHPFKNHAIDN
jgi:hypothetical protein